MKPAGAQEVLWSPTQRDYFALYSPNHLSICRCLPRDGQMGAMMANSWSGKTAGLSSATHGEYSGGADDFSNQNTIINNNYNPPPPLIGGLSNALNFTDYPTIDTTDPVVFPTGRQRYAERLTCNTSFNGSLRTVAWNPSSDWGQLLAIGLSDGRVSFTNSSSSSAVGAGLAGTSIMAADDNFSGSRTSGNVGSSKIGSGRFIDYLTRSDKAGAGVWGGGVSGSNPEARIEGTITASHPFQQPCLQVKWCPQASHLLALCHAKYHKIPSLHVWDVMCGSLAMGKATGVAGPGPGGVPGALTADRFAGCVSENVTGCEWDPNSPNVFYVGVSKKSDSRIKIFDLRMSNDSNKYSQISTNAVHGMAIDPNFPHRGCSYSATGIEIWDQRVLKSQLLSAEYLNVHKLLWCPARHGLLSVLTQDSHLINLNQVIVQSQSPNSEDLFKVDGIKRDLKPSFFPKETTAPLHCHNPQYIQSFSWNAIEPFRYICVNAGGQVCESNMANPVPIAFESGSFELIWCYEKTMYSASSVDIHESAPIKDSYSDLLIRSDIIRLRVLRGYSATTYESQSTLFDDPELFPPTDPDSVSIKWIWRWIKHMSALTVERDPNLKIVMSDLSKFPMDVKYPGILQILASRQLSDDTNRSVPVVKDQQPTSITATQYISKERAAILDICGWHNIVADSTKLERQIKALIADGKHDHAAALQAILLRLDDAIATLSKSPSELCRYASLALSGFSKDSSHWLSSVQSVSQFTSSPHLRFVLKFLTYLIDPSKLDSLKIFDSDSSPGSVKEEMSWNLEDLIGFAAVYLPSNKKDAELGIRGQLTRLAERFISRGNLKGLMLTGLTCPEAVTLMQNYVNRTGDVQTAALLAVKANLSYAQPPVPSPRNVNAVDMPQKTPYLPARVWTQTYIELLNNWQFWKHRARLEKEIYRSIEKEQGDTTKHKKLLNRGTFPCCVFCHHTLQAAPVTPLVIQQYRSGRIPKPQFLSCSHCKRPRPRCAICHAHLGIASVPCLPGEEDVPLELAHWLTYCQKCHHGGHAAHVQHWFKNQRECPVTGCSCECRK